jgi:hypothetical protein
MDAADLVALDERYAAAVLRGHEGRCVAIPAATDHEQIEVRHCPQCSRSSVVWVGRWGRAATMDFELTEAQRLK